MTPLELLLVALAGVGAGFINTVAGSGTLITFPTLVALGVPPVVANVSNNVGLIPGSVAGAVGWRRELVGQRRRVLRLATASAVGAFLGAVLLLALPSSAFDLIVPGLIVVGLVLVAAGPAINRRVAKAHESPEDRPDAWWAWPATMGAGVYGGYFGAAQGIILVGFLGVALAEGVHRLNALKNVLSALVNSVAALVFVTVAHVDWVVAALIGGGSVAGAVLGATLGRRLSPALLRGVILLVGGTALVVFLVRS
ncbi:sulfite exporter TauE/SafE family protein [Nocardioides marmoribigeumensis]|uniref:Probable membrane transporter protein n=1 Tax=Nocardioides marmoribigeumensis TaxID=433649 RepID=A0ABU2C1C6_9ACTN|nr:sulfite exporter TauE/SafE family protein [Nocardioides marmoribigeumensis]MDR7364450.1 putative membrane protein YfcA [Nocardioides marmoribigeumensis]